jgi:TolA-binding protein
MENPALKHRSSLVSLFSIALTLVWSSFSFAGPAVRGQISRVIDTAHLEFEGQKNWDYEMQRVGKNKIVLTMPPFDEATEARLNTFSDPFIKQISVSKGGPDNTYRVTFELADSAVESFDYLTDDPSRLIIDFYKKTPEEKPVVASKPKPKHESKKIAKNSSAYKDIAKTRRPASDEFLQADGDDAAKDEKDDSSDVHFGAFDASDANFDRFRVKDYEIREDAILASAQNIYLPFPMLKLPVSRLDKLFKDEPEYVIHEKPDRENKEARLLEILYSRGRYNVFLKTFAYFEKKHPDSDYLEILSNMAAHIYLSNWRQTHSKDDYDLAHDAYLSLIHQYPNSPLLERNNLILGYLQLEHGEALSTLQHFQAFLEKFPKSPEIPQVRKAIAEAYLLMHKYDDGLKQYSSIATDYPKVEDGAEAKYRMGDVEFSRGNWEGAVDSYRKVLKELPQFSKVYPNAHFNLAEALFWKKDFKQSIDEFVNFISLFPTHPYGGYAMTRIGELMGILGVDPRRAMGAFLESTFRYPDNPGAKIAKLRMLTAQMKNMRPKDLKKAIDEIKASITEVNLPGIEEFTTLLLAHGTIDRGEYEEALNSLLDYYQKHPTLKNKEQFTSEILRSIASEIKNDLDEGKFLAALQFESKYSKTWLHANHRIDIEYFKGRAFEQAGAWGEAEKIYDQVNDQLNRIAGTQEEKERRVSEFLPKRSTLQLRMAAVAVEKRRYAEAYQNLKNIDKATDLTEDEQIEKVQLIASVSEYRGEWGRAKAALKDVIKHWKGEPQKLQPAYVHLAELEMRTGDYEAAENNLDKVLSGKDVEDNLRAKALQLKGDSLLGQKRTMAAVEVYQTLLEQYETKRPLGSVRYKVGQLLFDRGDMKGAEGVWGKLQGGSNEILWDLAKEKLDHAKWQDDYRKYVRRIPAMNTTK